MESKHRIKEGDIEANVREEERQKSEDTVTYISGSSPSPTKPIGSIVSELFRDYSMLIRKEFELARSEVSDKVSDVQHGAKSLATGGAVLFFGVMFLLFAVVFGLAEVLPLWLSSLIVGGVLAIIGAALLASARKKLSSKNISPHLTIESLKNDSEMAKEKWHDVRKHG